MIKGCFQIYVAGAGLDLVWGPSSITAHRLPLNMLLSQRGVPPGLLHCCITVPLPFSTLSSLITATKACACGPCWAVCCRREGADLATVAKITLAQALRGHFTLTMAHLDGKPLEVPVQQPCEWCDPCVVCLAEDESNDVRMSPMMSG